MVHCDQSPANGVESAFSATGTGDCKALSALQRVLIAVLRWYKFGVSPWLPSACRFYPTCSDYMRQAIEKYGVAKGVWMGSKRLAKCHPLHAGGLDPVP